MYLKTEEPTKKTKLVMCGSLKVHGLIKYLSVHRLPCPRLNTNSPKAGYATESTCNSRHCYVTYQSLSYLKGDLQLCMLNKVVE